MMIGSINFGITLARQAQSGGRLVDMDNKEAILFEYI